MKTAYHKQCGENKKRGRNAARDWLETADVAQQIRLAGQDFEFGDTLNDLIADGFGVPQSADPHFSLGFFRQVKSKIFAAVNPTFSEYYRASHERVA